MGQLGLAQCQWPWMGQVDRQGLLATWALILEFIPGSFT